MCVINDITASGYTSIFFSSNLIKISTYNNFTLTISLSSLHCRCNCHRHRKRLLTMNLNLLTMFSA